MITLYFMRHAQSEANLNNILASQLDFPLTNKGNNDAVLIAKEFSQEHNVTRIIASPLSRAQQTASPFSDRFRLPVENEAGVTEQQLGRYAGKTYEELDDEEHYCHDRAKRWNWVPDGGGESYSMIVNRLMPFFQSLPEVGDEDILVVTHAVTMRMIKAILTNSLPEYPHEIAHNGEVWKVKFKGVGHPHEIESLFFGDSINQAHKA